MKREKARDLVYQIIFQMDFHDDFGKRFPRLLEENGLRGSQGEYARDTVVGVMSKVNELDDIIKENLRDWKFERLSTHVVAVLRLGLYEMLYNDTIPAKIALNEAVKLAHRYSEPKEARFVNGLLNTVYKKTDEYIDKTEQQY